jgi:MraZ protein
MWKGKERMSSSSFFFSGSNVAKLDEKNRFVLPSHLRYGLCEEGKLEFTLGLGIGGCLAIYRKSEIEKIVKKFQEKQHIAKFQPFFTMFFSTLHQTTCDSVGRMMIPALLKDAVGIKKEIVVAGVLQKIELWPKEIYDRNLQELLQGTAKPDNLKKMMEEAFALLDGSAEPVQKEEAAKARVTEDTLSILQG